MLKTVFFCIASLPNPIAKWLGGLIGRLFFYFDNREKRTASINIGLCFPELTAAQQKQLVKSTLIENTKTLLEMPKIFKRGGAFAIPLITKVTGLEHYHKAIEKGNGVILLAPHLGNWELTVHYLNQFSPITAMFAPPKQKLLHDIMKNGRQSSGAILVPADATGVRAQLKQLKKGGVVGILPDQQPKTGQAGVFAPFMGNDAYTMSLVHSLSKRTHATVLLTFAERLENNAGYHLHVIPAPEGIDQEDEIQSATLMNQGIEQCVKIAPAQYQWTYKRFGIQKTGKRSPYP